MDIDSLPPPGLDGTYRDSCVACLRGTDSAVAFDGEAEWIVVGLMQLDMTQDEALHTLSNATGCEPGLVPPGRFRVAVKVCRNCAGDTFKLGPIDGGVPCYAQPYDVEDGQHR